MKLYTEEQVIELCILFGWYQNYSIEEIKVIIQENQTPIELPSATTFKADVKDQNPEYVCGYMDAYRKIIESTKNK